MNMPRARPAPLRVNALMVSFLFALLGFVGFVCSLWLPAKVSFTYLTLLMIGYLAFEILRFSRIRPSRWLVNPVVLSSIFVFGLPFGITNALYFLPERYSAVLPSAWLGDFSGMDKAMLMALLAAFAMWRGYYSRLGGNMASAVQGWPPLSNFLRRDFEVHLPVIGILVAVSLISRLLRIRLGVFGYNSEIDQLYAASRFTEFLSLGSSLGTLALAILSLSYFFEAKGYRRTRILLGVLLVSEIAFGLISGMKSLAIFPPLVVATCAYIARGRLPKWVLIVVPLLLMFSYRVIEPFRDLRFMDPNFQNRSLSSIVDTLEVSTSEEGARFLRADRAPLLLEVAKRLNLTLMAAIAIEFKDDGRLTEEDPDFLRNILSSPAFAVIPRFLWPTKPYEDIGGWFNKTVLGRSFTNAVGMSPVGYLYLAGGATVVAAVFFLIGVWQRVLAEGLLPAGSGGCLLFVSQLKVFVLMPTSVYPILVSAIRTLPMVGVVQWAMFKR
ncbi:MAG: hypothetical protein AAF560_06610 [Acidobacteriota bacterium]